MPPWILIWIARFASGERFRKATSTELRWYSGAFAFIPIWFATFVHIADSFHGRVTGFGVWLFAMACLLVVALSLAAWVRFVPAVVSWIFGAVVWIIALYLAITCSF